MSLALRLGHGRVFCLFVVGLLGAFPAWGKPVEISLPKGPLRPGVPGLVWVAAAEGDPTLTAPGAAIRALPSPGLSMLAAEVTAPLNVSTLTLQAVSLGTTETRVVSVSIPEASSLELSDHSDASTRFASVSLSVSGASSAWTSEGQVAAEKSGIVLTPSGGTAPRVIGVAARRTGEDRPVFSAVRLRARVSLPYVVEAGARLSVTVSGRAYGPFLADAEGRVEAAIDQWPGETSGDAVFTDALGNETRAVLPLPGGNVPVLLVVPPAVGGSYAWLHVWSPDGNDWHGPAPHCTGSGAELSVLPLGSGEFAALLPDVDPAHGWSGTCTVANATSPLKVDAAEGRPARLSLRVWPDELDADFPSAEIRAVVEDATGERLALHGLSVTASRGEVRVDPDNSDQRTFLAEYVGVVSPDFAPDEIVAVLTPGPGAGAVASLSTGVSRWDESGAIVWALALDDQQRPLADVAVSWILSGQPGVGRTGTTGVAVGRVLTPNEGGAARLLATCGAVTAERAVRTKGPFLTAFTAPQLQSLRTVQFKHGRAVAVGIEVHPSVVRSEAGVSAKILITVRDRTGLDVSEAPQIVASEGEVGPVERLANGGWEASFSPEQGGRARHVEVSAEVADVRASTTVQVDPAPIRGSAGIWFGGMTNFGRVLSPAGGLDVDLNLGRRSDVALRLGGALWGARADVITSASEQRLASILYPVHAAVLLQRERRGLSAWAGAGGTAALESLRVWSGDQVVAQGIGARGGPIVFAGLGWRTGTHGQIAAELRSAWLLGFPASTGFVGNLGGIGAGFGYREVW